MKRFSAKQDSMLWAALQTFANSGTGHVVSTSKFHILRDLEAEEMIELDRRDSGAYFLVHLTPVGFQYLKLSCEA